MASDEEEMLGALGLRSMEELFSDIPPEVRPKGLDLPPGISEQEVVERVRGILDRNRTADQIPCFLGGGVYDHYVPAAVDAILSRSEFYTSYTPYQPEVSQGLLQALWEYQSLICELTGMEAANSSLYDGPTAVGEAALMSARITGRNEYLIPRALHREKRAVLQNYGVGPGLRLRAVDFDATQGTLDLEDLRRKVTKDTAGIYVETPNLLGVLEDQLGEIRDATPEAILTVGVNPVALGVVKPPGDYGADIVVGEGQPLGGTMSYGGPYLGIFACRAEHIRRMPGRVIGLTQDIRGKRAFCMTLQTREQHIRKEKAMSNICTNEALLALATATYLALLGSHGLRDLAWRNIRQARELMALLGNIEGFQVPAYHGTPFNEFVLRSRFDYQKVHLHLLRHRIQGGIPLGDHVEGLAHEALFATTERHDRRHYDTLRNALEAMR